jgi:D-alanyl-D-alanine carboxypeptidase
MRKQSEKVVKSRVEWRKQNEVKKLHIVMIVVAVFLCLSVAAGAGLAWMQMKNASDKLKQSSLPSAAPASSSAESLPVYDDALNLMLVNSSKRISDNYRPELTDYGSVRVDGRIVPALDKLMKAAKSAGCPLTLAAGYVDGQTQEKNYQAEVKRLMASEKLSLVRAEDRAQASVGRSGYSENQTGLSVVFSAPGLKSGQSFGTAAQYHWLVQNSVNYGFILRYPEDDTSTNGINSKTGCYFNPSHFRYVGIENALKMREYSMCMEEYISYLASQSGN